MIEKRWVKSSGTLNNKAISIQHLQDWQEARDSNSYPVCVQIAWNANQIDVETGFPSLAEQIQILALGEQLQALGQSGNSLLTMIITHEGVNQWVIYVKDLEQFKQELGQIEDAQDDYPLEMVANDDEQWTTFSQVYQRLVEPA